MQDPTHNKRIIQDFMRDVRGAGDLTKIDLYLAQRVTAHQLTSEYPQVIQRSPEDYSNHIKEFQQAYGDFTLEISEMIAEDDKVYVRWIQNGTHQTSINGEEPTNKPLTEYASCVYRLEKGKIVEYWIQVDRKGFDLQLSFE